MHAQRECVARLVNALKQLAHISAGITNDVQHRPEHLAFELSDMVNLNQRGLNIRACGQGVWSVVANAVHFTAELLHGAHMRLNACLRPLVNDGSHIHSQLRWCTHVDFGHRSFEHFD